MSEHVALVRAMMQGRVGLTREVLLDAVAADGAAVCARLSAAGADRIVAHLAAPPDPAAVAETLDVEGLELCAVHGAVATSRSVRTLAGLVRRAST